MVDKRIKPVPRIDRIAPDADRLRLRDERSDRDARLLDGIGACRRGARRDLGGRSGHRRRHAFPAVVETQHVLELRLARDELRGGSVLADVRHLAHADRLFLVYLLASVVVYDRLAATHRVLLADFKEV